MKQPKCGLLPGADPPAENAIDQGSVGGRRWLVGLLEDSKHDIHGIVDQNGLAWVDRALRRSMTNKCACGAKVNIARGAADPPVEFGGALEKSAFVDHLFRPI